MRPGKGAHNVLIAQTFRDFRKRINDGLTSPLSRIRLQSSDCPELDGVTFRALRLLESLRRRLMIELEADEPSFLGDFDAAGVLAYHIPARMCAEADWKTQACD